MDRFELDGSGRRAVLSRGYAIAAPGLIGTGGFFPAGSGDAPTRASTPATQELESAFRNTRMQEAVTIALSVRQTVEPAGAPALRSPGGDDALQLEVPDFGEERGQVVLMINEDATLSWHFPVTTDGTAIETAAVRGSGGVKRFRIPRAVAPASSGTAEHGGFGGAVGRKLLKVLVYPVTDPILGPIGELFARQWEERNRPYRVRRFTPDDYTGASAAQIAAPDWQQLARGPALLFVHGTFSTSHSCFGALPRDLLVELHRRYDGRVIAFDTFSLSEDPAENARRFLERIPPGVTLNLDVVCHSRGGLVTRQLAGLGVDATRAGGSARVRRVVFVGVPNAGTVLADPDHMVQLLDRFTSALVLLPSGPIGETMEAILTAVKVIGHGVVGGLPGLSAMRASGDFLECLNRDPIPDAEYYAITADFEPRGDRLASLVRRGAADAVMDRVFRQAANDLVVPTTGVYDVDGASGFPIPAERVLRFDARAGVIHTTYFSVPETARALENWLRPPITVAATVRT
jgi:hypothetical protein